MFKELCDQSAQLAPVLILVNVSLLLHWRQSWNYAVWMLLQKILSQNLKIIIGALDTPLLTGKRLSRDVKQSDGAIKHDPPALNLLEGYLD